MLLKRPRFLAQSTGMASVGGNEPRRRDDARMPAVENMAVPADGVAVTAGL
jgi:hypothetical protein